jgi:hypothetical protein
MPCKAPGCGCIIDAPAFNCAQHRCGRVLNPCVQADLQRWAQGYVRVRTYLSQDGCGARLDSSGCGRCIPGHPVKHSTARFGKSTRSIRVYPPAADQRFESHGCLAQRLARVRPAKHHAANQGNWKSFAAPPSRGCGEHQPGSRPALGRNTSRYGVPGIFW